MQDLFDRLQHLFDQTGHLNNGGFRAHPNPKKSEDKPEIVRPLARMAAEKLVRAIRTASLRNSSALPVPMVYLLCCTIYD
jgi:hypothetical protein